MGSSALRRQTPQSEVMQESPNWYFCSLVGIPIHANALAPMRAANHILHTGLMHHPNLRHIQPTPTDPLSWRQTLQRLLESPVVRKVLLHRGAQRVEMSLRSSDATLNDMHPGKMLPAKTRSGKTRLELRVLPLQRAQLLGGALQVGHARGPFGLQRLQILLRFPCHISHQSHFKRVRLHINILILHSRGHGAGRHLTQLGPAGVALLLGARSAICGGRALRGARRPRPAPRRLVGRAARRPARPRAAARPSAAPARHPAAPRPPACAPAMLWPSDSTRSAGADLVLLSKAAGCRT